ncbi:MAG: hypothetical protein ACK5V3_01365, partial [Bdellovibrionales bacterium]
MFKWLIFLLIMNGSMAQGRITDPFDSLPFKDQEIYLTTFHKCRSLSFYGAWWVGIDTDVALGNFTNLATILTGFDGKIVKHRIHQGLISPELHRKLNSRGYQLAIQHCFGNKESSQISNFAHQSIIASLYASEISAAAGVAVGVVKGAPLLTAFMLYHR